MFRLMTNAMALRQCFADRCHFVLDPLPSPTLLNYWRDRKRGRGRERERENKK